MCLRNLRPRNIVALLSYQHEESSLGPSSFSGNEQFVLPPFRDTFSGSRRIERIGELQIESQVELLPPDNLIVRLWIDNETHFFVLVRSRRDLIFRRRAYHAFERPSTHNYG